MVTKKVISLWGVCGGISVLNPQMMYILQGVKELMIQEIIQFDFS
jgi:hypothetical protein